MKNELVSVNIIMSKDLRKNFKIYCIKKDSTMNKEIVQLIREKINNE
jgi:hypothetical protein